MPVSRLNRKIRLRDLDTLVAVVRTGGVRKAAEFLHLSQPAVSRAISDLEASLGVVLLDRSRRGVAVTPFGEALLRRTATVFDELQMAVDEIEHLADPSGGNVHMGCMATLCSGIVARATEHLAHRYPRLRLRPWWSVPSGETRGRGSSPTSSPRRCTRWCATRAATTPATPWW